MKFPGLLLASLILTGQPPSTDPPYDPNDPEAMVNHSNGWSRFAWKRKGTWSPGQLTNPYGRVPGVAAAAPADVQQMTATLNGLTALLQATPEGGDPRGYFMKESRTYSYSNQADLPPGVSAARLPIVFSTGYFPFYIADTLRNGIWTPDKGGETESVYFYFNRLPGRYDQRVVAQEKRADGNPVEFYLRPGTGTTYRGFPVVEGQDLMIVRGGRDPWIAAPYGRALKAAMAEYEKDRVAAESRLANLKKVEADTLTAEYEQRMRDHLEKYSGEFRTKDPAKWKIRLAGMERELAYNREKARKEANPQRDKDGGWYWNPIDAFADASNRLTALTPEEAAKPACFVAAVNEQGRYAIPGKVLSTGSDPQCREIVMDNYGCFDQKLPRTSPQILLVRSLGRCAKVVDGRLVGPRPVKSILPPQGCFRHVPIWEAMDWGKAAGLLAP